MVKIDYWPRISYGIYIHRHATRIINYLRNNKQVLVTHELTPQAPNTKHENIPETLANYLLP